MHFIFLILMPSLLGEGFIWLISSLGRAVVTKGVQVRVNYEVREMESTCTSVHPFSYLSLLPATICKLEPAGKTSKPPLTNRLTNCLPASSVPEIPTW